MVATPRLSSLSRARGDPRPRRSYTGATDPSASWAYCNVPTCPASGSSSNSRGASIDIIIPVVVAAVLLVAAVLFLVRKRRVATATPDEVPQIGAEVEAAVEAS